jgi:hypothetical protein
LARVFTPVAAIAGTVARAATAALPQIKPRLESAATYFSPDLFFTIRRYFTIDCEIVSTTAWIEVANWIDFGFTSGLKLGTS